MKKSIAIACLLGVSGCTRESERVSFNLSREADSFNVYRRIVFLNGITDSYLLKIEGYCAVLTESGAENLTGTISVVCKSDNGRYVKHFLGVSDNVTYFSEQILDASVSDSRYSVVIRPLTLIPDVSIR